MTKFLSAAAVLGVFLVAGCAQTNDNMAEPGSSASTQVGNQATPSGGAVPGQDRY